jgi:hypothetical protein
VLRWRLTIRTTAFSHVADGMDVAWRAPGEGGAKQIKIVAGGGVASPRDAVRIRYEYRHRPPPARQAL